MPATETVPEPMPETEPQLAVSFVPEEKSEVPFDQVFEPAITSVPVGIQVELEDKR